MDRSMVRENAAEGRREKERRARREQERKEKPFAELPVSGDC